MRPRWPGWPTSDAWSCTRTRCARTTSIIRTSCAWTWTRCRAWSGRRSGRWPPLSVPRWRSTAWPAGRRRQGRAVSTSMRASSAGGRSTRCAARRWRSRARWNAAHRRSPRASGGRRSATASSWTTTRTRRIAPLRARTPCGPRRTRVCPRRSTGTRSRTAIPPTSRWPRCRPGSGQSATGTPAWTPTPARSRRCWISRPGTIAKDRAMLPGRRTIARARTKGRAWRRPGDGPRRTR